MDGVSPGRRPWIELYEGLLDEDADLVERKEWCLALAGLLLVDALAARAKAAYVSGGEILLVFSQNNIK